MVEIRRLTGRAVAGHIDDLARLRVQVFRDFPYLYDGGLAYERDYLNHFMASEHSVFVLALDAGQAVGAATGLPLADAHAQFRAPFEAAGRAAQAIFYFGESVLDPAWRGQGLGHRFFDEREAHARELGFHTTAFCAVTRPDNHPLRPRNGRQLEEFWSGRGYRREPGLHARFAWKDIDADAETEKTLQFWSRRLD